MLLCGLPCLSKSTTTTTTTTESPVSPTEGDNNNTNKDTDCVVEYTTVWRWRNIVWEDKETAAVSLLVLWLYRWLMFRISIGVGLIKIRGASCWTDETCLHYHFETQPVPSLLSFVFHLLPPTLLTRAIGLDLWVQLYTSWMVLVPELAGLRFLCRGLVPKPWANRRFGSGGLCGEHYAIGKLCLSQPFGHCPGSRNVGHTLLSTRHNTTNQQRRATRPSRPPRQRQKGRFLHKTWPISTRLFLPRGLVDLVLVGFFAYLSWPVVANLLQLNGGRQQMNASFSSLRLVSTYGAFGNVGKARYEPIVSVSHDGLDWTPLEFPCKPGRVTRGPCFCAPYHYRLDWNIW